MLGNPQDKIERFDNSGIYAIICNDCDGFYPRHSQGVIGIWYG